MAADRPVAAPKIRLDRLRDRQRQQRRDHDDLKDEEQKLRARRAQAGEKLNDTEQELRAVRAEIRKRAEQNGEDPSEITDHALVRYLQLIKGVDVEAMRDEIQQILKNQPREDVGPSKSVYVFAGCAIVVRDGKVETIIEADRLGD